MTPAFFVGIVGAAASIFTFIIGYGLGATHDEKRAKEVAKMFKDIDKAVKDQKVMKIVLEKLIKKIDEKNKHKT